jgi:hypothetical protein
MTSPSERVTLLGQLMGMGREAECKVSAFEVPLPGSDPSEYALVIISGEPDDLPDGRYHLSFDGRVIPVLTHNRAWLIC